MSSQRTERDEDRKRKAIYSGNKGISRSVWEEAMRLTRQAEQQVNRNHQPTRTTT